MISSPLRYPGGKAKLYPFFVELLKKNDLFGADYYEPYAGGAGLAIKLLISGFAGRVFINDIDCSIYAFWKSVLRNTDDFCALIERTPITVEEWYNQKEIWQKGDVGKNLELGFSAYFLNRTNRSGIIEGGGPIGGYAQEGKWKIGVRLNKKSQIENIKRLSKYADQIQITNLDALSFIKRNINKKDSITYLDPPYFVKGHRLYKNFYEPADHLAIARLLLAKRNNFWVVSYDDVQEIREAYAMFAPITYLLNYSAGKKVLGSEVIFLSDALQSPSVEGFEIAA